MFDALPPEQRKTLPLAALDEERRLRGAVFHGVQSRIDRCLGVNEEGGIKAGTSQGRWGYGRLGTVVTVANILTEQRYLVTSDFVATQRIDVAEILGAEPLVEREPRAWWERGGDDEDGTLTALVHRAAFKWRYDNDLVLRLERERKAVAAAEAERQHRWAVERRRANDPRPRRQGGRPDPDGRGSPPDDEWEPLA